MLEGEGKLVPVREGGGEGHLLPDDPVEREQALDCMVRVVGKTGESIRLMVDICRSMDTDDEEEETEDLSGGSVAAPPGGLGLRGAMGTVGGLWTRGVFS